jgi:pimeloyl-ACP methyl ester carboxylesterase
LNNPRIYGNPPFTVAVVHGGPGAAGEMASLARELAKGRGVLEPLQTALSLRGQIAELKELLVQNADLPVTLIGFSWGAWLSYLLAAHHRELVKKLILVGSGPFEEKYAIDINKTRSSQNSGNYFQKLMRTIPSKHHPKNWIAVLTFLQVCGRKAPN